MENWGGGVATHIADKGTNLLYIYKIFSNQYEKEQRLYKKMGC